MFVSDVLDVAERERAAALARIDSTTQGALGQFFTPVSAAQLIAGFPALPITGHLRLLDPGAGSGALTAAFVHRVLVERPDVTVEVVAIERDPCVIPHLRATMAACEQASAGRVQTTVLKADFILDSTGIAPKIDIDGTFDLVIQNPPYGKLAAKSSHRLALKQSGVDVPNLYAAFLVIGIAALKQGGQLVAITPRSFFNGPYFEAFRRHFLEHVALERIHVFDSRSSVFSDTGVLQENVVFVARRGGDASNVQLSASKDHLGEIESKTVPYTSVVMPSDTHRFIRIAAENSDNAAVATVLSQPCVLSDLGVQVSTGRVVDYRSRQALSTVERSGAVPLLYPGNLKSGGVSWPSDIRKPQWFVPVGAKERAMLFPAGWYVLVKRFSSKEEKRRIVASVLSPDDFPGEIAFENHLNVLHCGGAGLTRDLALGICAWLNSATIDKFFRTFSGHTQVNATDLRCLRFPGREDLLAMGCMPEEVEGSERNLKGGVKVA
ncbi:Eco57I restriction-modification methylase domain-containing protein [Buchananella felis]|uniref:Eco57I restriction-modification methylase domain-containing protein n=1 Tax=Buchananella felis TaxID=3231492 RepID=UPI003528B321